MRPGSVLRVARRLVAGALAAGVLAACGAPGGATDRDKVLAATCVSTIVRNGLPAPTAQQAAPARFAAERERLLASGRRFNTVSPYRNVCRAIREELLADSTDTGDDELGRDGLGDEATPP